MRAVRAQFGGEVDTIWMQRNFQRDSPPGVRPQSTRSTQARIRGVPKPIRKRRWCLNYKEDPPNHPPPIWPKPRILVPSPGNKPLSSTSQHTFQCDGNMFNLQRRPQKQLLRESVSGPYKNPRAHASGTERVSDKDGLPKKT